MISHDRPDLLLEQRLTTDGQADDVHRGNFKLRVTGFAHTRLRGNGKQPGRLASHTRKTQQ